MDRQQRKKQQKQMYYYLHNYCDDCLKDCKHCPIRDELDAILYPDGMPDIYKEFREEAKSKTYKQVRKIQKAEMQERDYGLIELAILKQQEHDFDNAKDLANSIHINIRTFYRMMQRNGTSFNEIRKFVYKNFQ